MDGRWDKEWDNRWLEGGELFVRTGARWRCLRVTFRVVQLSIISKKIEMIFAIVLWAINYSGSINSMVIRVLGFQV